MAVKKLDEIAKRFIVESLARFETPTDVAGVIRKDFGVEMKVASVEYYDPTKVNGQKLRKDLKELFYKSRQAFIDGAEGIGIAHTSWRIERLQRLAVQAMAKGNGPAAAEYMKQAAQDKGGMFTNKREITGKVDGSFTHEHSGNLNLSDARALPDDELAGRYREALGEVAETKKRP